MIIPKPKVSVTIPTYNGADLLVEAIRSVLDQTYRNFELIVVDDASPDHTAEAVAQFNDPRLKYIRHKENMGVNQSRITGIDASSGELIAWLDQDDLFHPKKLETHVDFLEEHPEVCLSYNSRFELNHSSMTIRDIWRNPKPLELSDLVLGFPIAPSDMVIKREWVTGKDLWERNYGISGGEIPFLCRLKFAGCGFGHVDRALNYRRHHSGRIFCNLSARCESELECQELVFNDPRCPPEVLAMRDIAFMNTFLVFSSYAFMQHETALAQQYLSNAVQCNPAILEGDPSDLVLKWIEVSVADESQDHELLLRDIFAQLPPELAWLSKHHKWAVGRGYLLKAVRAIIWDRPQDGQRYFAHAQDNNVQIDDTYLRRLTYQLINYENEFGNEATREVMQALEPYLRQIDGRNSVRRLRASYLVNSAFRDFRAGKYGMVPKNVISAITNDPSYLANRGVISILLRSTFGINPVQ